MVNIDTVYQRVLAMANKEQRGYITPQEFNLFANQAQMNIFEQYFYDLNQFERLPGNDTGHSDVLNMLREKISFFEFNAPPLYVENNFQIDYTFAQPAIRIPKNVYRVGSVRLKSKFPQYNSDMAEMTGRQWAEVEMLTPKQFNSIVYSPKPLIKPTRDRPIGYLGRPGHTQLNQNADLRPSYLHIAYDTVLSETLYGALEVVWLDDFQKNRLAMYLILRPHDVKWGYTVVTQNDTALYDPSQSTHFDLHDSEEVELVNKILALAGITIRTPELYQAAVAEDNKNIKQEKQ